MLSKKQRLPIQLFVSKRGKLAKTPYFLLKTFSPELSFSRFGVAVSAKKVKKATQRNKLRRMVYNFIREYYKEIPNGDYWITVLPSAVNLPKEKFRKELEKLLLIKK